MSSGRPTLGDVARIAGVHKATASRALNPATVSRVHPETALRVREAAENLGYRPNMNARGLRLRSTRTIGVLIPDMLSQLYPPLLRGIERELREHDHFMLIADSERDAEREGRALDSLIARQVDGVIAASHLTSRPALRAIAAAGTPVVVLDDLTDVDGLSVVGMDLAAGVDVLTELLVAAGHRTIGLISGPETPDNPPVRADLVGAAMSRLGLDPTTLVRFRADAFSLEAGFAAAVKLLADRPDVTAVMGHNDIIAIGALQAARDAGLRVPEDLTVTGFNDGPLVDAVTPPLTTVRLDMMRLGREAAEVLMASIAGSGAVDQRQLPVTLELRGSHGPVRADA